MSENHSHSLLTTDDVQAWVLERQAALEVVDKLDRKLLGVRMMFPELADKLLGMEAKQVAAPRRLRGRLERATRDALPLNEKAMTDVVLIILEDENGGRPPRWFREKMLSIPGLAERVKRSPTGVSNALSRLTGKKLLKKVGPNYYLPNVYERVEKGEIDESGVTAAAKPTFNTLLHDAMKEHGKPFKAADAMRIAKHVPELVERLTEQPSRVYSWLSRETFKNKLVKEGEFYRYPSERDTALSGIAASAVVAGEVTASPTFENQTTLRLIG